MNVIPNVLERYMAFVINKNLIFIDSIQFMNLSLDKIVKNLSDNDFKYLSQKFNTEQLSLVKQKGVYLYEYMGNFEKFSKDKLPDKNEFYSSLKDTHVSKKGYLFAIDVWSVFKMNSTSNYHELYSETVILLLTDVFEKFINWSLKYYGLDPCHYLSRVKLGCNA